MTVATNGEIPQVTLAAPILVMRSTRALIHKVKGLGLMGVPPVATLHVGGIRRYFYEKDGVIILVINDDGGKSPLGRPKFGISLITKNHKAAASWLAAWIRRGRWGAKIILGSVVGIAEEDGTFVVPSLAFMNGVFVVRVEDRDMGGPAPIPFVEPEDWSTWNGEN